MTRRIQWTFLLLGAIAVFSFFLLWKRVLGSLELERAIRHRTVAERIMDEMESELTAFLQVEEGRPVEHYRYYLNDRAGQAPIPSPLSEPPTDSFLLGYFQIAPDGSVSTPRWPDGQKSSLANGDGRSGREKASEVATLEALVAQVWSARSQLRHSGSASQDAGTTIDLGEEEDRPRSATSEILELMRGFNRGLEGRRIRQLDRSDSLPAARIDDSVDHAHTELIYQEPMVGLPVPGNGLLLYRTVPVDGKAYRQGMVIDTPVLLSWLSDRVLSSLEARTGAQIVLDSGDEPPPDSAFRYRHRFAEPFSAVSSFVMLEPLPVSGSRFSVYLLSLLLAVSIALLFISVYRMVSINLAYAERRNEFVASVTHELKTPLTSIRMYGEMLRDGMVRSETKRHRYYELITSEAERLTRLVYNILAFGHLEKQTHPMNIESGEVAPLISEVASIMDPAARKARCELKVSVDEPLGRALFDHDALKQILFNLLDNAIKYSRDQNAEVVEIHASAVAHGVRLTVSDQGPGVPKDSLERIWQPFERGSRETHGSGLGLSLVHDLAKAMGARVKGRNLAGRGFEVVVDLQGDE